MSTPRIEANGTRLCDNASSKGNYASEHSSGSYLSGPHSQGLKGLLAIHRQGAEHRRRFLAETFVFCSQTKLRGQETSARVRSFPW